MSITAIIMAIIGLVSAGLGALIMRPIAKSSGFKEGVQKQAEAQQVEQSKAIVEAVQERAHVDQTVNTDSDDELDARLRKHSRPAD